MTEQEKPDELRSLEDRLKKARQTQDVDDQVAEESQERSQALGLAFKMGIELVVGTGVGGMIGWALDDVAGTRPWLFLVFLVLGFAAGITNIVRDATKHQSEN